MAIQARPLEEQGVLVMQLPHAIDVSKACIVRNWRDLTKSATTRTGDLPHALHHPYKYPN